MVQPLWRIVWKFLKKLKIAETVDVDRRSKRPAYWEMHAVLFWPGNYPRR